MVSPPTHVLAVYSELLGPSKVALFPVYGIVIAALCSNIPPLPPSTLLSQRKGSNHSPPQDLVVSVPIIPTKLPSVEMFQPLLSYLYTRNVNQLFDCLLPFDIGSDESMEEAAKRHAQTVALKQLLNEASRVQAIWSNIIALGIFDDDLFSSVEMVWNIYSVALEEAARKDQEVLPSALENAFHI